MIEFYLGGSRSGKSKLAEQAAVQSQLDVSYIATATAGDQGMIARIAKHQQQRPQQWQLIEEPLHLADALISRDGAQHCLLVDCLTLWLSNCLYGYDNASQQQAGLAFYQDQKQRLLEALSTLSASVIFVSNETNMGVIPMAEMSREFCDQAGLLHQEIAAISDKVTFAVAGLSHVLKAPPSSDA